MGLLPAFVLLIIPVFASAQLFPQSHTHRFFIANSGAFGDLDLDGDLDLVLGDYARANFYLNMDGHFPGGSYRIENSGTRSVALGDLNGDGYLDAVVGGWDYTGVGWDSAGVHINDGHGGFLPPTYIAPGATSSIALGDLDNDGDLDIVLGSNESNDFEVVPGVVEVYLNLAGQFGAPAWVSGPRLVNDVTPGDVDNDGDLDFVVGVDDGGDELYLNEGGTFPAVPSWTSGRTSPATKGTQAVALGDTDGDGDLDLVATFQGLLVYENQGAPGYFPSQPTWSRPGADVGGLALGDIDLDGTLDVAYVSANRPVVFTAPNGGPWLDAWTGTQAADDVVLGDIDNDGDLDLVTPSEFSGSRLYTNQAAMSQDMFGSYPLWTNVGVSWNVALGDANGDHRLDLLRGPGLFLGNGDTFDISPIWQPSSPTRRTYAVKMGDVDGDGDLDAVFTGNAWGTAQIKAYFCVNEGGTWDQGTELNFPSYASDLALGDVDDDGDLDVVVSSGEGTASHLFLFSNGAFESTPSWTSRVAYEPYYPLFLSLADVDGDVDLDLIGANAWTNGQNYIFRNDSGALSPYPTGNFYGSFSANAMACADMNADGSLDLMLTDALSSRLHLNDGTGIFARDPAWVAGTSHTFVTPSDVDGDGDLDMIVGSSNGQQAAIFENVDGAFQTQASWSWPMAGPDNHAVVTGDIDNDGDADLVVDPSLFKAKRLPVYKGDPTSPTRQLPNNGALLRDVVVTADPAAENEFVVSFSCIDVESDRIQVLMDYHFEGDSLWSDPAVRSPWLPTSPQGAQSELRWNTTTLPLDPRNVELRLRVVESPTRVSAIQHASTYLKSAGRILPHRPMASWSGGFDVDQPVTVGDSTSTSVIMKNLGDQDLVFESAVLPSPEVWLENVSLPFTIPARQSRTIGLALAPRLLDWYREVRFTTNDPGRPEITIGMSFDALWPTITSQMVSPLDTLALGEAVTLLVTPDNADAHIERGDVYYRASGSSVFQTVPLSRFGSGWIGIIPGDGVNESGLDYYIEVENSGIFARDPWDAPLYLVYHVPVRAPISISSTARPTSGADFLAGRGIEVQVSLPKGATFASGLLHYRAGGESVFQVDTLEAGAFLPSGIVPESVVGGRGVEYWVQVETATRTLTDPPMTPANNPRRLPVTLPSVQEPSSHAGKTYRMVSFPLSFDESFAGTIEDVLVDEKGFGEYNIERWRSWAWVTENNRYGELSDPAMAQRFRPQPGRAFWLVSKDDHRIDTGPVVGKSTPSSQPYEITLKPGWTMIGDPFAFAVAWSSVLSEGIPADEDTLLSGPYGYGGAQYRKKNQLEPFLGYWVHSAHAGEITLRVPPVEAVASTALARHLQERNGWNVRITAHSVEASDDADLGVATGARDGRDRFDELEPPMSPHSSVSLYAINDSPRSLDRRDVSTWRRDGGVVWAVDIAKNFAIDRAGDEVTLRFETAGIPVDQRAVLLDRKLGREVELGRTREYSLVLGERSVVRTADGARFIIAVGTEAYLAATRDLLPGAPAKTVLHQNTPNPFNPATVIRYDLAAPANVALRIYDLRGALVRNLEAGRKPAGRYEVGWNGDNERGERVASGVYFYELRAGSFRQTKKMVLLK